MREAIAICQSLPGPLAIQVGIYVGYLRGGFWGAWIGGWAFILPNFLIVAALGALYVRLGDLKPVTAIFYGVSPAVIALILHSCYRLAKLGMEDKLQWAIAAACLVVTVILQAEVALLFLGAGLVGILYYGNLFRRPPPASLLLAFPAALPLVAPAASGSTLGKLLLFFLKAGSLTFGSGLVIVPFLEKGVVEQYGWLDQRQFLIAVAVGMISPGRSSSPRPSSAISSPVSGARWSRPSASSFLRSFLFWSRRLCSRATVKIQTCKALCGAPMLRPSARSSALASCLAASPLATG